MHDTYLLTYLLMALAGLHCAEVPLRNCSLTQCICNVAIRTFVTDYYDRSRSRLNQHS